MPVLIMPTVPTCPVCLKQNTYQDVDLYICADCFHEWSVSGNTLGESSNVSGGIVRDENGNPLADGDSVILMKDLKVKGSSTVLKKGTKVKSIRLGNASDGHEVDCRMEAGNFMLKAEFLKKAFDNFLSSPLRQSPKEV
jgi:protein PhnA